MQKYVYQWNYRSGYGAGAKGDVVDLDDETAAAINRDSPGVLVLQAAVVVEAPPVTRDMTAPPQDRQVKTASRRSSGRGN